MVELVFGWFLYVEFVCEFVWLWELWFNDCEVGWWDNGFFMRDILYSKVLYSKVFYYIVGFYLK